MAYKFNPFTGKLDYYETSNSVVSDDCIVFFNYAEINSSGEFNVQGDSCCEIKDSNVNTSQKIKNSVTINASGEMIIDNSSNLEVA